MMWGLHCVKTWGSTQATVALSSAEAELYALTNGASQKLGVMTLIDDIGWTADTTPHTDASAAIGIVRRTGFGKLKHLNVKYLWVQDQLKGSNLSPKKILGTTNPADLLTKHLAQHVMQRQLYTSQSR